MTSGRRAGYYSRLKDEINTVSGADPKLGDLYYANSGSASILGAEAEGELGLRRWDLGASYAWTRAEDTDSGLTQYEFPPHMAHGRATFSPHSAVRLTGLVDVVGKRPRQGWSPDAGLQDGPAYALVHMGISSDFIAEGRVRADLSVQNLLNTDHDSLIYLDDANAVEEGDDGALVPEFPSDIAGPGRSVVVGIEARL
jgi:outer membrane receptor protein involved in Fe transport